ncbi:MAG: hypothetical protein EA393_08620 [Bacteroidetes bacterium]|nr:MAG: hypothetical protein EA393_08620 [Bacteroidota bacterium]
MLKRIFILAIVALIIQSCNQATEKGTETAEVKKISELVSDPLGFEGKEVVFEGVITHICRHSGDKMRVNQLDDADFSIMVMLEDFQTQINSDFEGRNVKVSGVLKTRVRNLDQLEENHDHDHAHDGEEGHECSSTEEAIKQLEKRGITPDIVAYIEMKGFEISETIEMEETKEEETESVEVAEASKPGEGC